MAGNFVLYSLLSGVLSLVGATPTQEEELCLTPSCSQAAANVLNNLHPDYESIDPCEDFDQFACGGFPSRFPDKEVYDTLTQIQTLNEYVLRTVLETPYSNGSNSTSDDKAAFDMLVTNYNSCTNETAINASALGGIPDHIKQITELFPVGDDDYSNNNTLTEQDYDSLASVITYLSKIGVPIFGEFWTISDPQFPDVMVPQFGFNQYLYPEHALPSRVVVSELAALKEEQLTELLGLILPDGPAKNASSSLAKSVLGVASAIAAVEATLEGDPLAATYLYTTATVEEAAEKAPALVLDKVISALAPEDYKLDRMIFQNQDVFVNVSSIVSNTPKSTLQALMMVMVYNSFAPYVSGSITADTDRWPFCYQYIDDSMPWIAGKFFVDATYSDEKRDLVKTMAEELRSAFGERVKEKHWFSDETKALIEEKISEIILKIGYPDHTPDVVNATDLLQYYAGVNTTSSLYDNVLSGRKWAVERAWKVLNHPTDPTLWPEFGAHSYVSEARYGFQYNHIIIGSGITQAPALYMGAPSYLMYGGIGYIAGHEVTHGFDANGRLWNNDRQYKDWWDDGSVEEFKNRSQCFIDQYSAIEAKDYLGEPVIGEDGKPAHVNGEQTLSENIADAGGLANAWVAWKKHEEKEPSKLLPGLDKFTKEQMFFIGMGQMFCSKFSQENMLEYVGKNGHAPPFARIRGATANSKAFKETWQCKKKEPECEIW